MPRIDQICQMLTKEPNDTFLLFALGMEYYSARYYEQAMAQFDRVIELVPDHDAAYMQKARALVELERYAEARQVLDAGMAAAQAKGKHHAHDKMRELHDTIKSG